MFYKKFIFSIVLVLLVECIGCSSLLYYPDQDEHFRPSQFQLEPETLWISTEKNQMLHGWYFHAKEKAKPKAVVIFFHGNGENLSSHYLSLVWLLSNGYDFFVFDYQGYGKSQGQPTPEGTLADGRAILNSIYTRDRKLPIVVLGQSLGGAVALRSIIEEKNKIPIRLVVVDSSFISYRAAARSVLSQNFMTSILIPFTYLAISDSTAPLERIKEISPTPLVVIHGTEDKTIHYSLGEEIFKLAGDPKEFWEVPGGRHIETFWKKDPNIRERLLQKLDQLFCRFPCKAEPLRDKRGLR